MGLVGTRRRWKDGGSPAHNPTYSLVALGIVARSAEHDVSEWGGVGLRPGDRVLLLLHPLQG